MEITLKDENYYREEQVAPITSEKERTRGRKVFNAAVILFIAVALVLTGLRFACGGLCTFVRDGSYTAYLDGDAELRYSEVPLFGVRGVYERIDTYGGKEKATEILDRLAATGVRTETIDDVTVIYAFSPLLPRSVVLKGERTNVMIALTRGKLVIGSPLIKGSY